VDPGLQGSTRVLEALHAGNGNIYIAVRPSNLAGYAADALGRGQRELLLLHRLTAGMSFDAAPENDFAQQWALPDDVRLARFFDPAHEVLALYSPSGSTVSVGLPAGAQDYSVATLDGDNQLLLSPLNMSSVELGRNVLLLFRDLPE
jgi:hypothetical protein